MTDNQKHQALVLEFYPFSKDSPNARFIEKLSNYARYAPSTRLTDHDARNLERLFNAYVRDARPMRQP